MEPTITANIISDVAVSVAPSLPEARCNILTMWVNKRYIRFVFDELDVNYAFLTAIQPFMAHEKVVTTFRSDDRFSIAQLDINIGSESSGEFPIIRADIVYIDDMMFEIDEHSALPDTDGTAAAVINNLLKNVVESSDVRLRLTERVEQNRGLIRANGIDITRTFCKASKNAFEVGGKVRTAKNQLQGLRECIHKFASADVPKSDFTTKRRLFCTAKVQTVPIKLMSILAPIMHLFGSYTGCFFPSTGIIMNRTITNVAFIPSSEDQSEVPTGGFTCIPSQTEKITLDMRYLGKNTFARLHMQGWKSIMLGNINTLCVTYKNFSGTECMPNLGMVMMRLLTLGCGNFRIDTVVISDDVMEMELGLAEKKEDGDTSSIWSELPFAMTSCEWREQFKIVTSTGDFIFADGDFIGKYASRFGFLYAKHIVVSPDVSKDPHYDSSAYEILDSVYPLFGLIREYTQVNAAPSGVSSDDEN